MGLLDIPILDDLVEWGLGEAGAHIDDERAEDQFHMNAGLQREFAQMGIQWKVADAKAAGIHPLYALGASTNAGIPIQVEGGSSQDNFSRLGQNLSSSFEEMRNRKHVQALQNEQLKNEVRTGLNIESQTGVSDRQSRALDQEYYNNIEGQINPHVSPSKPKPFYERYTPAPGFEMLLPVGEGEGPMEIISSMSMFHFNGWVKYNRSVYGPGWEESFWNWYGAGIPPGEHFKGDRR